MIDRLVQAKIFHGLWYFEEINRFVDVDGRVIHCISELFPLWQLEEWKKHCYVTGERMQRMVDRQGRLIDLYFVETPKDAETFDDFRNHLRIFNERM